MKIAIKSMINSTENYGSNLQNFALQKALQKLFPDSFIYSISFPKGLDPDKYSLHRFIKNAMNFDTFNKDTDYFLWGSDQIWNYRYFVNCNQEHRIPEYTLATFSSNSRKLKCFSYASSTGGYTEDIFLSNRENIKFCCNILSNFDYPGAIISFREKETAKKWKLIADSLGFSHVMTRYDIDPVFLLPSIEYLRLMRRPKICLPENYSIKYLSENMKQFEKNKIPKEEYLEYMERIQNDPDYKNAINLNDKEIINDIGIEGFFYLIKHAKKVFTDSFHAFAFFIILRNKNFIFAPPSGDLRIKNIKEILNIKIQNGKIVNRAEIEVNIKRERERSLTYLKSLFKRDRKIEIDNIPCYLVQSMNLTDMLYSKSGGFTCALARYIFSKGGVCYGVGYTSDYRKLEYKRLEQDSELSQIRGSKYFEITGDNKFNKINTDLEQGRLVLFIGVPCYIDKLKKYLNNKTYDNLVTCSLICNGYAAQDEWNKFFNAELTNVESISYSKIDGISLSYKNGTNKKLLPFDFYKKFCFKQNCYCEQCYECNFKWPNIDADFIVGDNNSTLKICCNEVILLTDVAKEIFADLDDSGKIFKKNVNFDHIKMNKMLFQSHKRSSS